MTSAQVFQLTLVAVAGVMFLISTFAPGDRAGGFRSAGYLFLTIVLFMRMYVDFG